MGHQSVLQSSNTPKEAVDNQREDIEIICKSLCDFKTIVEALVKVATPPSSLIF
jgi:hypothetical protein